MKSLLLALCCFSAALATPAQAQWSAVMTQSTARQAYNSFNTIAELETFIQDQAKDNKVINEVVYGDGKWYGVATYMPVSTKISWQYKETFPSDWVSAQWKEKKYITKVTYGDGNWFVVMTDQTRYLNQSWAKRSSWAEIETYVKDKWKQNNKYNITDIAYGDGLWYVVMSEFKEYEAQSFKDSEDFPDEWIDAKYKDNYNITSVENDGTKWYMVATKQASNPSETIFNPIDEFPKKKIQEKWDGGKRITSLVYVNEDELSDEDIAALSALLKSNKEKAADKLAAKDYPEAIKYYKAVIAEGNADEVSWNNLAWAKYLNGDCADALDDVNKAISMKSTSYNNHTKASILKCQNKCAEAIKYYDEAIRLYRKEHEKFTDGDYYADRADVKRCLGNYSGAIEDIELAMAIEPYNSKLKETLRELNKLAGNK